MKLVLASKSPRRREILSMVTTDFEVRVSGADENSDGIFDPYKIPEHLAKIKGEATPIGSGELLISADTVVIHKDKVLGKPKDKEDAKKMLRALSGSVHHVVSGIYLKTKEKSYAFSEVTEVKMRPLSDSEIETYVNRLCPTDKAGAYGIQEMAGAFVEGINGDFYNVVGLPLCHLAQAMKNEFDIELIK